MNIKIILSLAIVVSLLGVVIGAAKSIFDLEPKIAIFMNYALYFIVLMGVGLKSERRVQSVLYFFLISVFLSFFISLVNYYFIPGYGNDFKSFLVTFGINTAIEALIVVMVLYNLYVGKSKSLKIDKTET